MLFEKTKKTNHFGRALLGTMHPDDYLSYITDGQMEGVENLRYMTISDSRKNMRRDFHFISSDLKNSVKAAQSK